MHTATEEQDRGGRQTVGSVQGVASVTPPLWIDRVGRRIEARLAGPSLGDGARGAVETIRGPPTTVTISVAGVTAGYLDAQTSLTRRSPP